MKNITELKNEMDAENLKLQALTRKAVRNHKFFPDMQEQTKVARKAYRAYWDAVDAQKTGK